MTSAWRSQTGTAREKNEDACHASDDSGLYCVADGVGGAAGGEVASRLAVEAFVSEAALLEKQSQPWPTSGLEELLSRMNSRIVEYGRQNKDLAGLGTTFSGLIPENPSRWWMLHSGDSRAYGVTRDTQLVQLTKDHTLAEERISMGLPPEEQVSGHRAEDILTNYLGSTLFSADVNTLAPAAFRLILLCTDGLTKMLSAEEISALVRSTRNDPDELCEHLIQAAEEAGSGDDITLVAVQIRGD